MNKILSTLVLCIASVSLSAQFMPSVNVYRIPYEDGELVEITNDHNTHNPPGRIDMISVSGDRQIVAAADGVIEWIEDSNTQSCSDGPPCTCAEFNNYVWISHVNGEWTKYTHFVTGTVTALGHEVGDAIAAGTLLGNEGDVGCATGDHLHFEVAFPVIFDADTGLPFNPAGGFMFTGNDNRIPVICGITGYIFDDGEEYVALPCFSGCPTNTQLLLPTFFSGTVEVKMADVQITSSGTHTFLNQSAGMLRAGERVILGPGFQAQPGSRVTAMIRECNEN